MSCLFKYYVSILRGGGGARPMLIMLTQGGVRVWNNGKHAYVILAHFLYLLLVHYCMSDHKHIEPPHQFQAT